MPTYAVRYTYDERTDVRDLVRPEHRAYLSALVEHGTLLGSGPFTEGDPGALLVFRAESPEAVAAILADDPFVREGVVAHTDVRSWDVVLGPWSA
ncbi:YciI family protein [uncultured Cellulomonas sp.]|uniref:YciI family protein n=1 Tax=uncultured Cellulomonas sp. TaxID=189682 RepID=UPI0028F0A686|nr:YciI family protein [uncultured Cellulomonas sp.]